MGESGFESEDNDHWWHGEMEWVQWDREGEGEAWGLEWMEENLRKKRMKNGFVI